MAVTNATVVSVANPKPAYIVGPVQAGEVQVAEVLFTVSGTYAQANNSILSSVNLAIQNSRRNGKVVTVLSAMRSQTATKQTDQTQYMSIKTEAVVANGANWDVTFEVTDNSQSTEFADATALTVQDRPFAMMVAFTEA